MMGSLLLREWQILRRAKGTVINPMAFLFLSATLFAIAAPALVTQQISQGAAAGILWTLVLLTQLLALDGMYRRDFDSGLLEQLLVTAQVPFVAVLSRIFMQWLSTGFIIVLSSPLLAILLGLSTEALPAMALALLLGTPALSLLGSIGASVTVGFNRGGVILALLVLPLFLPTLIFGADLVEAAQTGRAVTPQAYVLGLISLGALALAPFATLAGLKISLEMQ
ncbi:MAG: heme exporter protein CcmB [Proteobacteria bacterium]|nr:heme exporter protein CcmB [Pseudomonadota bacterium]